MGKMRISDFIRVTNHLGEDFNSNEAIMHSIQDKPYENQEVLIKYMKSAFEFAAKPQYDHDIFTEELIPYESLVMTDKIFSWSSELLYYVEKYNLKLNKEFMDRAVKIKKLHLTEEDFR